MLEVPSVQIDTADLLRRLRAEIARRRTAAVLPGPDLGPPPVFPVQPLVAHARQHAGVGAQVPPLRRIPFPLRPLARALAWVTLKFGQIFTHPQREVNRCVVDSVEMLALRVEYLERHVALLSDQLQAVQQATWEQQFSGRELANLQSQLEFLDRWVRERLAVLGQADQPPEESDTPRVLTADW